MEKSHLMLNYIIKRHTAKVGPETRDSGHETHTWGPGLGILHLGLFTWEPGPYFCEPGPNTFTWNAGPILRNPYINTTFS